MSLRRVILAAFGALALLASIPQAHADWYGPYDHRDWRAREWREHERERAWREHEWREHQWREYHHGYERGW